MKQQKFRASRGFGLFENFCCAHIMVTPRSWSLPADENPTWPWVSIHRCSSVLYRYLRTCLTILFICLWFWTHPWFNMSPQSKLLIKRYGRWEGFSGWHGSCICCCCCDTRVSNSDAWWTALIILLMAEISEIRRSPVGMENIPLFIGFYTSQVVSRISSINSISNLKMGLPWKHSLQNPVLLPLVHLKTLAPHVIATWWNLDDVFGVDENTQKHVTSSKKQALSLQTNWI